ncbi:MAG TPA: cytochrome c3 family protein [Kineosporiaceae bacterium]|nr:cytochrome c3 family protein [Kineosporiaceae bacterium]
MRKLAYVVGISLAMFAVGSGPAWADNGPHRPQVSSSNLAGGNFAADNCASCHRAHTAQASYLLKQAQPDLCYSCHGAGAPGSNTDVYNGQGVDTASTSGWSGLRGGGFVKAAIDSANAKRTAAVGTTPATKTVPTLATSATTTSSHSVDGTLVTAWGGGATGTVGNQVSLRCGSCHDPHGNGNYRILRPIPQEAAVATGSTGVTIPDTTTTKVYTTANYWTSDDLSLPAIQGKDMNGVPLVDRTGKPVMGTAFTANIAGWCTQCHTRYLAPTGSYQNARASSTGTGTDPMFTYQHRSDAGATDKPNCITCHVAHGSNASMGPNSQQVAFPDGVAGGTDSKLLRVDSRGTCVMCHSK